MRWIVDRVPALLCLILLAPMTSAVVLAGGVTVPSGIELTQIASGLNRPVAVRHAGDGSNRLFIVEQDGLIRIYDPITETILAQPFIDLVSTVDSIENEQGLLGLAFDPNYSTNGFFYVNYTMGPAGNSNDRTRVERYEVSAGDPNVANDASGRVVIDVLQDSWNHNGGDIHFSPVDGYLYIGMGDGGGGGDGPNNSQTMNRLLGKMLRIDPHEGAGGSPECGVDTANYTIPADNPFVDGAGGDCDEIWHAGLRNPWRWSFDRLTGDMFIGDVGQELWEEVDYQPFDSGGGENFGWRCYEGDHTYNTSGCGAANTYDFPIMEFSSGSGTNECSVVGGYRYRGPDSRLSDSYIFADYCSGEMYYSEETSPGTWEYALLMDIANISAFGEGEDGTLYVSLVFNGQLHQVGSPGLVFEDGFESGDTTRW